MEKMISDLPGGSIIQQFRFIAKLFCSLLCFSLSQLYVQHSPCRILLLSGITLVQTTRP